jgi:hypothetical protein
MTHWRDPNVLAAEYRSFTFLASEVSSYLALRDSRSHQAYTCPWWGIHVSYELWPPDF